MSGKVCRIFPSKRFISLIRPTETTCIPTQVELKNATDASTQSLFSEGDNDEFLSTSRFQVLGQPATMASALIPPSIDLYVRRGCLVSLHGSRSISLSHEWQSVWFNLTRYFTLKPSIYYKLISTAKFNALIAPNFTSNRLGPILGLSSSPFRTLCLLSLDGTKDWNIWGKDSIVAYEANTSLDIKPSKFSIFKSQRPVFSSKYQILQGRGNVLLSGSGSVYTIELKDASDEITIKSEHLLGLNGSSQLNIKDSVEVQTLAPLQKKDEKLLSKRPPAGEIRDFDVRMFFEISRDIFANTWNWLKRVYSTQLNGPSKFLRIKGPRTLLLQSSYNVYLPASAKGKSLLQVDSNPALSSSIPLTKSPSKDYLSYASVLKDGQVDFRSTEDFSETLKHTNSKQQN